MTPPTTSKISTPAAPKEDILSLFKKEGWDGYVGGTTRPARPTEVRFIPRDGDNYGL